MLMAQIKIKRKTFSALYGDLIVFFLYLLKPLCTAL